MNLEYLLYLGVGLFVIDAIVIIVRGQKVSTEFNRYLEEKYPAEYHRMVFQDFFKRLFRLSWHKDSLPYFTFISKDDLGDPRIALYKSKLKWSFYSFLLNGVAAVVFFAIVALWIEYSVGR